MDFKKKLDFCIIPSPYSGGQKNLVFVTYHGANQIDEKLCLDEDYELTRYLLSKYGFQEIDFCTFESTDSTIVSIIELKKKLSEAGLKYSKPFEFNIMSELDTFKRELSSHPGFNRNLIPDTNIFFSTTSPILQNSIKSKIPEIGEKITLYFYLFLQCHFVNENDCVLELVGDLYSKENTNTRNYLQITKSEFVRLESKVPNVIMLQSTKTYKDFINEISFLHKGNFKFVKPLMNPDGDMIMKTKEFVYNIMEIKKNINPIHRIVVEVNLSQYYDDMIKMSKKIKKESSVERKRLISLDVLKPEMLQLKQRLSAKMLHFAETDEFEKANSVKTDIGFIDNKLKIVDNLEEKNITQEEYFKTFCLND